MTEQQITRVDNEEEAKWGRRIRILIDAGEHELARQMLQEWIQTNRGGNHEETHN